MPNYTVYVGLVLNDQYEVVAADADEAADQAMDLFRSNYELPHDGEIVVDEVQLREPDDDGEDGK